jgi:hypothetical protein
MILIHKIHHFFRRKECVKNTFWFYDVLFCNKCKRSLAYYTDYENGAKLVVKDKYKKYLDQL